ncbi:BTAD domain-containing putative transcriptional regulator [Actinophytocola sp.]|uniref:AfsR/SARP family transcriptional regulator n=1 Tax=Actinophytocola sp. TaxID=1872138 RepID=UPI00389A2B0C
MLGEVTAQFDQRLVDLGTPRQRCVLAALAVDAGRLVPADRLVGRVWGADPPRRGRATLQTYVSRLRGTFAGAVAIVHRSDGYALEIDQADQAVDLLRFHALRDRARGAGDDTRRVALLTDALALWHGQPLSGLSGEWVEGERSRWLQERWAAEHDLVDAQLAIGLGDELVAPLSARAGQHPLDERVAGQYMLALHRAGRSADALDHYRQLRERLIEELGTDPGAALQNLHQQILTVDPNLLHTPAGTATQPVAIPRQLPAAPAWFVGRHDEFDRLDTTLPTSGLSEDGTPSAGEEMPAWTMMLISAIGGTGGIGKTWLALTWAHRNLDRFPDGQLFVDLRGFSPTGRPVRPADVLGGFLDALGVDRDRQPTDPDRRAELYRSLIADKQMLVVLDNAATTDQVTPLLPGGHHCTVLVTSRNQLRGLIARHGARPIHLDVLTDAETHALLAATLGPDRVTAEQPAVAELIDLCGGFPLALGLIAAHAAADPHLSLADIAAELRTLGLDALDSQEPTASLPAVLFWSLHHLSDEQREVFALLGIAPGPDTGLPAAAALTGLPERKTHAVLRALTDASLINRTPSGRYAMHDLVRAYAITIVDYLPTEVQETALRRVVDFYTHTARAAAALLDLHRDPTPLDSPAPGVHLHPLHDIPTALAWFDTEHASLLAAQHTASTHHWHSTVWWLAWSLHTFHYQRGHHHDRLTVWQAAVDAAVHLPDPTTSIHAHRYLGLAYAEQGRHENAITHLDQALTLAEHHHNPTHQAQTHQALAWTWEQRGDGRQALAHARRALDLLRGRDRPVWEADALGAVGWCAARLGDYDTARDHCQAALTMYRHHDNPTGEATTLESLAYIDHHNGHHQQAINRYHHALSLYRYHGNTYDIADTLDALGHPHAALKQTGQARTVWRKARTLYQEQGRNDDATRVQHQLDNIDSQPPQDTKPGT